LGGGGGVGGWGARGGVDGERWQIGGKQMASPEGWWEGGCAGGWWWLCAVTVGRVREEESVSLLLWAVSGLEGRWVESTRRCDAVIQTGGGHRAEARCHLRTPLIG